MSEVNRLEVLNSYQILDTLKEDAYDDITQLATSICNVPISLISFVDDHRQWFKSKVGLEIRETPIDHAFCAHAIRDAHQIMEVEDARSDARFQDNQMVTGDPNIRFYAGAPLVTREGVALGTICVIDKEPRTLSNQQKNALQILSRQVMRLLEARKVSHRYQTLFESTSDLIYELNDEGKYEYVNSKVTELLGYSASELQNIVCWDMIPEEYRQETLSYHLNEIKQHKKSIYSELPIKKKDGTLIWLRQTVDYTYDDEGRVTKTYVIAKDISDLKSAIDEQDNLVAVIAHDLRSPLNQIYGLSDLLNNELTGELAVFNDMIKKISADGRKMIDNLVYLKAYEKSGFKPVMEDLDLQSFYQLKIRGFSELAKKKSIELGGNCSIQDSNIKMDEGALSRITDNLISNAIKFSPEAKKVVFELLQNPNTLQLRIIDEGPGFSEDDKEKLFQKFKKLSARPTGGERSTGLGLSIVHTLITGLEGTIELHSESGKGSIFEVRIPLRDTIINPEN